MSWKYAFSLLMNFSFTLHKRLLFDSETEVRGAALQGADDGNDAWLRLWLLPSLLVSCGKGFTKKLTCIVQTGELPSTAQPWELGGKVNARVERAAHTSCKVLNAHNPFANTCLVVGHADAGLMISQWRRNMRLLG